MYKLALLAALGLVTVTSAQAGSSDFLLGFNDAAGPSAAQNDLVIDLGVASQFTANSTFSTSFSGFSAAYSADGNALNDVAAGVVEGFTGAYPKTLFVTALSTPPSIGSSAFNNAAAVAQSPTIGEYGSASTSGWTYNIAASPTAPGTSATAGDVADQTHSNPLQSLSSGIVTENLFEVTKPSSLGTPSAWSEIGTFTIDANADTVSYTGANVAAVPEPATYGLLSGAGMLLLGLRRQFTRKA